jgi:hypothetical protein
MAPIVGRAVTDIGWPYNDMCCAGTNLVITTGAAVGLRCARCRYRTHFVLISVGPDLDTASRRQRR